MLAVVGVRTDAPGSSGRGSELIDKFTALPGMEFKCAIDVDRRYLAPAAAIAAKKPGKAPTTVTDFRRVLEDKEVGALLITTPDHWHEPRATLAAKAGKRGYVEKPCSHNPREGEILVAAATHDKRLVQMGRQRRSMVNTHQMVQERHEALIEKVFLAPCFYCLRHPSIGFGKKIAPPRHPAGFLPLDDTLKQPAVRPRARENRTTPSKTREGAPGNGGPTVGVRLPANAASERRVVAHCRPTGKR